MTRRSFFARLAAFAFVGAVPRPRPYATGGVLTPHRGEVFLAAQLSRACVIDFHYASALVGRIRAENFETVVRHAVSTWPRSSRPNPPGGLP